MKQKIKKLITHHPSRITHNGSGGFTLIEIAMVLIIVGLLLSVGIALIGPLTKRAKIIQSRESVNQAKEAVLGWTVKNGYLPANITTAGGKDLDGFERSLLLIRATEIDASSKNVCRRIAADPNNRTTLNICRNGDCTSQLVSNIAFVIVSGAENYNIQAGTINGGESCPSGTGTCPASETCVCIYDVDFDGPDAGSEPDNIDLYTTDINRPEPYDDIVQYVSLDEIRSAMGCPQPLAVTSSATLLDGEEDSYYTYLLQAIGGRPPYMWTTTTQPGSGLSLNSSGLISGTININSSTGTGELITCNGTINVSTSVTDQITSTAVSYTGTISVRPKPLSINTSLMPSTTVGTVSSSYATLVGTGGTTPYSWGISGNPAWLSVTPSTGVLRINNPTPAGTYSFTATMTEGCATSPRPWTTSKNFVITVNEAGGGATTTTTTGGPTTTTTTTIVTTTTSTTTTTACPTLAGYRVWNGVGARRDFWLDSVCDRVNNNSEITNQAGIGTLNSGENLLQYSSQTDWCDGTLQGTLTYSQAACCDTDGDGRINYVSDGTCSDR